MEQLTIGAFGRAARISPRALRLYDELGLLSPARVDPVSQYRLYDPAQLEQARLVAWLRRLGQRRGLPLSWPRTGTRSRRRPPAGGSWPRSSWVTCQERKRPCSMQPDR